jgi:sialate O-acetylesterase
MAEIDAFNRWRKAFLEWRETGEGKRPEGPGPVSSENPWSPRTPAVLYENMIAPLSPYTTRGVIWYQGEGNAGKPEEYRVLFPAMIKSWREAWNKPLWPFYFVQLAAYGHPSADWPGLRAAQAYTRDNLPFTGMALAIDVGEKEDIHPRYKQPVGERLALLALDQVYDQEVISRGPLAKAIVREDGSARIRFGYVAEGLQTSDGKTTVPGFEVAGDDRVFRPAAARIVSRDEIELSVDGIRDPAAVRYAWQNWPEPPVTLQNSAGLPAEPFLLELKDTL